MSELLDAAKGTVESLRAMAEYNKPRYNEECEIVDDDSEYSVLDAAIAATEKRYAACDHETHDEQGAHDYCPKCGCPMWAKYGGEK